ncbi:unnamed protein product [Lathyrus sativus]|nr:unnamed protein product [Lathyrus sativus]
MKFAQLLLLFLFFLCSIHQTTAVFSARKNQTDDHNLMTYIVHVKKMENVTSIQSQDNWYHSFLLKALEYKERVVFSYHNVASGFAVKLTQEEAEDLREKHGVVSVRPERKLSLHTTHTPTFLGLKLGQGLWTDDNLGKGIIIGLIDSGINPFHPSFSGEGMPPPPAKWKGHCQFNGRRTCNNKLIGARNLVPNATQELPFESMIHGTHTAAIAGGRFVENASLFGNAKGVAAGMAPNAHIAIYKVCDEEIGCPESSVLAAMDKAIEDGVDVLSLSLGFGSFPFFEDPIAVGAFAATQKGIFVSCSAGNYGPNYSTLVNEAPWFLTVGASTHDRKIAASAKLGNGEELEGETLMQPKYFSQQLFPLVYAGALNRNQSLCLPGSLKNMDVRGKVVLCDMQEYLTLPSIVPGQEVLNSGGVGMILANSATLNFTTFVIPHVLPAVEVTYAAGLMIKDYINKTYNPKATLSFKGTEIGDSNAPSVVSFSSRGPSQGSPGILKPDIIGPGLNILAAWPDSLDNSTQRFNIISGTSMSCPHLSGIAAVLKNSHPDWSPAAIKSAIMTTANKVNLEGKAILDQRLLPADLFATGAGHVNPLKANDPGLVYDIETNDYIAYLCGLNYTDKQVGLILQQEVKCSEVKSIPQAQLNYPSFSILLGSTSQFYTRTLTNVGPVNTTYNVVVDVPLAVDMSVSPSEITFNEVKQKVTYFVGFIPEGKENRGDKMIAQGSIKWVSGKYSVSIPVSVVFV